MGKTYKRRSNRRWLPREEYLARKRKQGEEALQRVQRSSSPRNDAIVIEAFMERGIPENEIIPRENCLVIPAWNAKGRKVKKGEKGVRVDTLRPIEDEDGNVTGKTWTTAFVFHISQTEPMPLPQLP